MPSKLISIPFLLFTRFITTLGAKNFDWVIANTSVWLSSGAYCPPSSYLNRTYYGFSEGFIPRNEIADEESDTRGFIGVHPFQQKIYVVFRGSTSIINWIEDMDAFQVEYHDSRCNHCKVHDGFYYAEQSVIADVERDVKKLLDEYPSFQVVVTGHSLGAALASLAALDLQRSGIDGVTLINFGSPRFGNVHLAEFASEKLRHRYRVTHSQDPAPHCPFHEDFTHISGEWYEDSFRDVRRCSEEVFEDPQCAYQWYLNIFAFDDHMSYLGVGMGCAAVTKGEFAPGASGSSDGDWAASSTAATKAQAQAQAQAQLRQHVLQTQSSGTVGAALASGASDDSTRVGAGAGANIAESDKEVGANVAPLSGLSSEDEDMIDHDEVQ